MCSAWLTGSTPAAGKGSTLANGQPCSPIRGETTVKAMVQRVRLDFLGCISEGRDVRIISSRPLSLRVINVLHAHAKCANTSHDQNTPDALPSKTRQKLTTRIRHIKMVPIYQTTNTTNPQHRRRLVYTRKKKHTHLSQARTSHPSRSSS